MQLNQPPKLQNFGTKSLSFEEAKQLLLNVPTTDISNYPAVKPKGGFGYFFQGLDCRSGNDFACDQYRFYADGRYIKNGVLKRYYKIRVLNSKKRYLSSQFERHVYSLLSQTKNETSQSKPPLCLVHYIGDASIYEDFKHGNSKRKTGIYLPTMKNVMNLMEAESKQKNPKKVYEDLQEERSSATNQNWMPVDRPRNKKQCENAQYRTTKHKKISNDEFFSSVELAIQLENFVRKFVIYPEVIIHLADEKILETTKELIRLSETHSHLQQLLSYDTTFLLGNFYVSILVARNTYFENDPIFPVAFLIHTRKFSTYHRDFFFDIFAVTGIDKSECVPFITDREKGITQTLKAYFPQVKNIHCTNHILKDVEYWLKQHGGKQDIKVLKDDITQLIDCETKEKFDEVYSVLSSTWSAPFLNYIKKTFTTI